MSDHRDSSEIYTGTERLLAFSDGVFAIAITLLVLDINVPDVEHGVISKLLHQWPSYLGYVLSFFVIGIIWAQHHEMFSQIKRSNHVFVMINIFFLMWVAFLPFPTALLSEGLTHSDAVGRRAVVAIYTGTFLLGGLLVNLQWQYAIHRDRLLGADVDHGAIRKMTWNYAAGPILYMVAFGLAFISPPASIALIFLINLFFAVSPLVPLHRVSTRLGDR